MTIGIIDCLAWHFTGADGIIPVRKPENPIWQFSYKSIILGGVIMHVVIPVRTIYPIEPAGLALPTLSAEDEARRGSSGSRFGKPVFYDEG